MKRSITILSILFTCILVHAQNQVAVYNTGIFFLAGDTVSLGYNFTNASSASLTNNGVLEIKGDLDNDESMSRGGSGKLIMNGNATQTVHGNAAFKTNDFTTANPNGIHLSNSLSVSGHHNFATGMITTENTNAFMVYENDATYTGVNDAKHVNGWVKKIGSTNFVFPVGNASLLRTIAIQDLNGIAEFNCKYNAFTPNITQAEKPIVLVNNFEYWNLNRVSGSTAKVLVNWNHAVVNCPAFRINDIKAVEFRAGLWTSIGGNNITGSVTATGSVLSDATNNFGMITFGSVDWLLSKGNINLSGNRTNGTSKIQWQFKGEQQPVIYEIERSMDGSSFISIAKQNAISNINSYQYIDTKPVSASTFWYRIKGVAANGETLYSTVITLNEQQSGLQINTLVSNKTVNVIASGNLMGSYQYSVINMTGQVLDRGNINLANGAHNSLYIPQIKTGNYVILVEKPGFKKATKIFVQ